MGLRSPPSRAWRTADAGASGRSVRRRRNLVRGPGRRGGLDGLDPSRVRRLRNPTDDRTAARLLQSRQRPHSAVQAMRFRLWRKVLDHAKTRRSGRRSSVPSREARTAGLLTRRWSSTGSSRTDRSPRSRLSPTTPRVRPCKTSTRETIRRGTMLSSIWIVLKSNARSFLCGLAGLALCASAAGCSLFGASHSAPACPPPVHRGVQQLKTPAQPPVPVSLATMYPMPEAYDPNEFLPGDVEGADGTMYASVYDSDQIAKFTTDGTTTAYPIPDPSAFPTDMVLGPDGNVWFTESIGNAVDKITTAGVITPYHLDPNVFPIIAPYEGPRGIAVGPNGDIIVAHVTSVKIIEMSTAGTITAIYPVAQLADSLARLTTGPDGNIWFTEDLASTIGRLKPSTGKVDLFPTPTSSAYPASVVSAADGNLWFTERDVNQLGRITTSGVITEFQTPTVVTKPWYMISGPDGSLWCAEFFNSGLGRVDPVHLTFVEYRSPIGIWPLGAAAGPNGSIWLTDEAYDAMDVFTPGGQPPARSRKLTAFGTNELQPSWARKSFVASPSHPRSP